MRTRGGPRAAQRARSRFVHCIEGGFHLGATPDEVDRARPRAGRPRRALHHARAPVLAPGRDQHARAAVPARRASTTCSSRRQRRRALTARRGRRARDVRAPACSSTSATCARTRSTRRSRSIEALDRETGRDPREYPVIASHAGYRFGRQQLQPHRRDDRADRRPRRRDRADLRPAPDQRRPAAHGHEDARRVARRARPPHRRDRPRARRDRLRPRRLHQADARRRSSPPPTSKPFAAALRARYPETARRDARAATPCASSGGASPAQHPDAAHLHQHLVARRARRAAARRRTTGSAGRCPCRPRRRARRRPRPVVAAAGAGRDRRRSPRA